MRTDVGVMPRIGDKPLHVASRLGCQSQLSRTDDNAGIGIPVYALSVGADPFDASLSPSLLNADEKS
jgi:hypothetical protein